MFGRAESVLLIVSRVPGYLSGLKLRTSPSSISFHPPSAYARHQLITMENHY